MFSKTLILAVLCCTVVIANAAPQPQQSLRVRRAINDKVRAHLQQVNEKIKTFFGKFAIAWRSFWDRVSGRESRRKDQEIRALKAELARAQEQSSNELEAVKAKYQKLLAAKEKEIDELQGDREQLARAKRQLAALQKEASDAINGVLNNWDDEIDKLGGKIEKTLRE